jgi:hypothetical protein
MLHRPDEKLRIFFWDSVQSSARYFEISGRQRVRKRLFWRKTSFVASIKASSFGAIQARLG